MASKYWIKLYHEILEDPKMGRLPDNVWRRCIELFLMAGELDQEGQLPDTGEIAWRLRQSADKLEQELHHLQAVGIIEANEKGWFITKFAERQAPVSSTERSRYSRQKAKENATNRRIVSNILPRNWAYSLWKSLPNTAGIYRIFCSGSGLSYVGASRNIQQRIKQHLSEMTHSGHKISDDLYIYGPESLKIEVLEETLDESELPKLETKWLLKYMETLYNTEKLGKNHRDRIATNRCTDTDIESESDKDSSPNGEAAKPPLKPHSIPAVQVFVEVTGKYCLSKPQMKEVAEVIGDSPTALEKWHEVVKAWIMKGFKPTNAAGMLEWFKNGIPVYQQNGASNGQYKQPKQQRQPSPLIPLTPAEQEQFARMQAALANDTG